MFNNQKADKKELERAAKAMVDAGYPCVTVERVRKVTNEFNATVYVAVVGDAMAIYTPDYKMNPVKFVCF